MTNHWQPLTTHKLPENDELFTVIMGREFDFGVTTPQRINKADHRQLIEEVVRAMNSHAALVEALTALETAAKTVYNDPYSTCRCADSLREPLTQARAALAKAKGE